jgi:hypothetical protein
MGGTPAGETGARILNQRAGRLRRFSVMSGVKIDRV